MTDEQAIAAMDDEELFAESVRLRDAIADGDDAKRKPLALIEAERLERRAKSYAPEYAAKAERAREAARILRETKTIEGPTQTISA